MEMVEYIEQIFVRIEFKLIQNKAQQNRVRIYGTYYEHDMAYDSKSVKNTKIDIYSTYSTYVRNWL